MANPIGGVVFGNSRFHFFGIINEVNYANYQFENFIFEFSVPDYLYVLEIRAVGAVFLDELNGLPMGPPNPTGVRPGEQ